MKQYSILRIAAFVLLLTVLLATVACNGGGEETDNPSYSVTVGGTELKPDADMATVLASITETYKYSESSACPPFEGVEKLYDFTSVKITTYAKDGKDLIMGIFLKDDSVSVSGVKIGMSADEMKAALGENYTESGSGIFIYPSKGGGKLKCIVRDGNVASIQLLTKQADS